MTSTSPVWIFSGVAQPKKEKKDFQQENQN